jgi:hypothetical protein
MRNPRSSPRRAFIASSIACAAVARTAPSDRVTVGIIGSGGRAIFETRQYPFFDNVEIVAVCDAQESRRIVACVYDPAQILAPLVGFENHLNYFHVQGCGLPRDLAKGLAAFLNSTPVDVYFRQFNGHTQVNATDLRRLNYPTKEQLQRLGRKVGELALEQSELDALAEKELNAGN